MRQRKIAMRKLIFAIFIAMSATSSIEAQECGQLFIKAAKHNQRMVDASQRIFQAAKDGLDGKVPEYVHRYYSGRWPMKDRYEYLVYNIAQWGISWALDSMTAALDCAAPMVPKCRNPVFRASLAKDRLLYQWEIFRRFQSDGLDGVGWARRKGWAERYLYLTEKLTALEIPFRAYFRAATPAVLCFKGTFGG